MNVLAGWLTGSTKLARRRNWGGKKIVREDILRETCDYTNTSNKLVVATHRQCREKSSSSYRRKKKKYTEEFGSMTSAAAPYGCCLR